MASTASQALADAAGAAGAVAEERKGTAKLEFLREQETWAQGLWQNAKLFEVDAPVKGSPNEDQEKFMCTFPYPYTNGLLHLGHSFSLSKAEFAAGFQRLNGKRVLFPFAFHVTGMPIKASADKVRKEVEMFGADFSGYSAESATPAEDDAKPVTAKVESDDPTKIVKKHGKAEAKKDVAKYQFQIMESMGIPRSEIAKFADPVHWLYFFPPLAEEDLKALGVGVDWRRKFFTTDLNPYYDSFIRWQFNHLRNKCEIPKVKYGERYTIYSPLDGQPCMDHDRASGEGIGHQEYTAIKMRVMLEEIKDVPLEKREKTGDVPVGQKLTSKAVLDALGSRKIFCVAATLRPETMYGQTNCYVGSSLTYGLFVVNNEEAYICTDSAARNMAYQGIFSKPGVIEKIAEFQGSDLIGLPLKAPLAKFDKVYMLPMEGVLATKGTGVVTSVPADSPDDYITMCDLKKKAPYYKVQQHWVDPFFDNYPVIISTPGFGDRAAETIVKQMKIQSQKDTKALAEAKKIVYKAGFYEGTMITGSQAGKPVQEAKNVIRDILIEAKDAFPYAEPEGLIISRSGDECVVTLAPQWYMDYGEDSWKALVDGHLKNMELYAPETRNQFEFVIDWLKQWACSRSFGLGSRMPWDKQYLIESLSDSTIYMAYYTVSRFLQNGTLDGSNPNPKIKAEEMTDEVWDYIMLDKEFPKTTIDKSLLDQMKNEFEYFYPMDLRVSGKDLINNHLTFALYNHTAIFPKEKWPLSFRTNGHLLLNNLKMSKSTGNFLTIKDALKTYGADATRFALADAGDGIEDANFVEKTADGAILRLFTEFEWIQEAVNQINAGSFRKGEYTWNDKVFESQMESVLRDAKVAYEKMLYREALKLTFYELTNFRSEYRKLTTGAGLGLGNDGDEVFEGMHEDLVNRYIELQAILLAPITPHWCEAIYMKLLGNKTSVRVATWPKAKAEVDTSLLMASSYVRGLAASIRSSEDAAARKKKKRQETVDESESRGIRLFIAEKYPDWQVEAVAVLESTYKKETGQFSGEEKQILAKKGLMKNKMIMPFIASRKVLVEQQGPSAFKLEMPFKELESVVVNKDSIRRELHAFRVTNVEIVQKESLIEGTADAEDIKKAEPAMPGQPTYRWI